MNKPIITSMLDNDLYKFTMMQAVLHQFPGVEVEYAFKCRTEGADLRPYFADIADAITDMCLSLSFTQVELDYLSKLRFIKPDFIQFLKLFKFEREYVHLFANARDELEIQVKGPWLHTILFEVPILAIVSEIYSTSQLKDERDYSTANNRLVEKIELIKKTVDKSVGTDGVPFLFADFGTRRRFSTQWHYNVVTAFKVNVPKNIIGTSNVLLARLLDLKPIGTMAHEWLQAHQALYRVADSQFMAFENWAKEYRGDLGIALSDVVGLEAFLCDFDMYFAKLFDGTRQDSGNPHEYACRLIDHYKSMGIDPTTKTIVFSDGLSIGSAINLWQDFRNKIKVSFGIGTHLTNDFDYNSVWPRNALQIVLKMVRCNGQPVAKLSDTPGKTMCQDGNYMTYLATVFARRIKEWKLGQR